MKEQAGLSDCVGMCHRCTGGRLIGFWQRMGSSVAVVLCVCDHCGWRGFQVDN